MPITASPNTAPARRLVGRPPKEPEVQVQRRVLSHVETLLKGQQTMATKTKGKRKILRRPKAHKEKSCLAIIAELSIFDIEIQ